MIYFSLDKTIKKPLYKQIVEQVETIISDHEANHFDMLPSEVQFSQIYHISSFVVKKAYKILEDKGLIVRVKGKGTFIKTRKIHVADSAYPYNLSVPFNLEYSYKVLSSEYVEGISDYYKQLKLKKDNKVKVSKVLVSHKSLPICYFDICLRPNVLFDPNVWLNSNILLKDILKDLYHGDIEHVTTLNVANADKVISDILNISIYDPIVVVKTAYFKADQPVCCLMTYYPGEYTVFLRSNHEKETNLIHSS